MKVITNQVYKSIPKNIEFDIPDFCVLTGKNGSGKSHLLEALAGKSTAKVFNKGIEIKNIHHVGFNGLNPQVDEQCDSNQVLNNVNQWWGQMQNIITHYKSNIGNGQIYTDIFSEYLPQYHGSNPVLFSIIDRVLKGSKKKLEDLTQDDLFYNMSFVDIAQNQLFFSQCAMIFKAYHTRLIKNEFAEFRTSKPNATVIPYLSTSEFNDKYGPPPWDLINDILKRANLPYEVSSPDIGDFDLPYRLRLIDKAKSVDISVNDLSSGEKVLMCLALAIYNTQEGGSKPDLLLLDEPDAALHPQFSKLLIETIIETIIKKTGVSVVITTHSPSTVAMAPIGSVYEIDKETKIPKMVSNLHAVGILTEGISYLKVSYEKRKQVFVESKYDVQYFERLHNLLSRKYNFEYQPIFLEPHSGTSNCTDVISIVEKLRTSGSDLAFGIIDFDNRNNSSDSIYVLGAGSRYAIENYILEPIYVSLALIRHGKKSFNDFGIIGKKTYTEAAGLTQDDCQKIIDCFLKTIGISDTNICSTVLENGFIVNYPQAFLLHSGHEYERKIQDCFTELNAISRGQGDAALKIALIQVIEEFPQFLPIEISETLIKIIGKID